MPVTDQQARAIAFLAAAARPTHARRWDEAGIVANVKKVADRNLSTVVIAVMQAAEDRNAASPGVIPTPGPHWRNPESAPAVDREPFDPRRVCNVCSRTQHAATDHEFESIERRASKPRGSADVARHALAAAATTRCPHGVTTNACPGCRGTGTKETA